MRGEYSEDLRWTQVLLRCSRGGVGWSGWAESGQNLQLAAPSFFFLLEFSRVGCRVSGVFYFYLAARSDLIVIRESRCPANNTANFFLVGFRRAVIAAASMESVSGAHRSLVVASVEAVAVLTLLSHPLAHRHKALAPCLLLPAPT